MNQQYSKTNIEKKLQNTTRYEFIKSRVVKCITNNINLIIYIAAITTVAGGIFHLLMLGPSLKPVNFPMQLLPYTDSLFTIAGILQIFWCIPMIKRWGINWYYIGLVGTIGLSLLLLATRIPNGITNLPLEDKNPMALFTEITQFLFISATIIIIKHEYRVSKFKSIGNHGTSKRNIDIYNVNQKIKSIKSNTLFEKTKYEDSGKNVATNLKDFKSLNSEGIRLRKLGKDKEAIESFEQSLKINPNNVKALYNMGVSLNRIGRKNDAITVYCLANQLCRK
jgi:tetratricopeptide (TPR) repeat protein